MASSRRPKRGTASCLGGALQSTRKRQMRTHHRGQLRFEALEERRLLSLSPPILPQQYASQNLGGYLTGPADADPLTNAQQYMTAHAAQLGLTADDISHMLVTDRYQDGATGVTHLYLRQEFNGLDVDGANFVVNVMPDGRIVNVAGGFVPGLRSVATDAQAALSAGTQAIRSAADALARAVKSLDLAPSAPVVKGGNDVAGFLADQGAAVDRQTVLVDKSLSLDEIPARLHYVPNAQGGVTLAWDFVLRTPDGDHWYDANANASTGELMNTYDWVDHATYNVYPRPVESPDDGSRSLVTDPATAAASPYGWHDTNGVAGAEYTDTRGNNVSAQEDVDNNNSGGFRPDGSAALNFDYALNLAGAPSTYQSAAITNLFYWNNICHDVHFVYGFTEAAGSFQTTNYSGLGAGNDAVQADAQDGSGTNNANFSTPPDGYAGRMQMYVFTYTSPYRDGDLDNQIIVHEYGHGVSNRMVGGPSNANALDAIQSGGMGEGWSDWWGLMFTQKSTDTKLGRYPVGTYVLGQPPTTGSGIRRYPYSYDMTIDPETFSLYNSSSEVHNAGEIWCSVLWDLNWLLIDRYGFDGDLSTGYTGSGSGATGNKLALRLVEYSLTLMPANPSFLQSRDAILQADQILTGGTNYWTIWQAFARRGMGYSAVDGGANSTVVTQAFDLPANAVVAQSPADVTTVPPATLTLTFGGQMDTASFSVADDVVSFTSPTGADLKPQITGFTWTDTSTLQINFTAQTTQGAYTMLVGPQILSSTGAPMNQDGDATPGEDPDDRYAAVFRYDLLPLQVVSTNPAAGGVLAMPSATVDVNLNEAVDPATVGVGDVTVSQGSVTAATVVDADTIRYTIGGVTTEAALTFTLSAGALADVYGNPNLEYATTFSIDLATAAFPTPLAAVLPLGSFVYQGSFSGLMNSGADSDSLTLTLDPGQKLTAFVIPDPALQPVITILGPSGTTLGTATATAAGKQAVVQSVVASAAGTYTLQVTAAGGTSGAYALWANLNAAVEDEAHDGAANDTLATAQNLNPAMTTIYGTAQGAAVLGTLPVMAGIPVLTEDFASTTLGPAWSTYSSVATGRIQLSGAYGTAGGSYAMLMDNNDNTSGTYNLNEAVWTVNLASVVAPSLVFSYANWNDETNVFGGSFTGHYNADGIAISADGATWYPAWNAPAATTGVWQQYTIDLAALAAANGLALGANFKIKFQQYDNFNLTTDGLGYDQLSITTPTVSLDWYQVSLTAGQSVSMGLQLLTAGNATLSLYDSGGQKLAQGAAAANLSQGISNYVVPTTGTYYVQVAGSSASYNLAVGRGAAFDVEDNDSLATAEDLGGARVVVGHGGGASAANLVLDATYSGWWNATGLHDSTNSNYIAGHSSSGNHLRNFFVFDLGTVSPSILSAQLRVANPPNGFNSVDPTETYTSFDVATPLSTLVASGAGQTAIFDDLGTGTPLGSQTVSVADNGQTVTIDLNADGVSYLNAARGSQVALGGAITTLSGTSVQSVFAYSGSGYSRKLSLSLTPPSDFYSLNVVPGLLTFATATPGDGAGEFVNLLDPYLELYDPNGNLVASNDNGAPDGRNALLTYNATVGGKYTIRVGGGAAEGDYVLAIQAGAGTPSAFAVTGVTPSDGALLSTTPPYTVSLNDFVLATSVQAADLVIDGGLSSATAFAWVDGKTLAFTLPALPAGAHTLSLGAGALLDLQSTPLQAFSSTLVLDLTAPRITASSVMEGDLLPTGGLTYTATFSENMDTTTLDSSDFRLVASSGVTVAPTSFSWLTAQQVQLQYSGLTEESYTLTLNSAAGAFQDPAGNLLDGEPHTPFTLPSGDGTPGGSFHVHFAVDMVTAGFPVPLTALNPAGSLIYTGSVAGTVGTGADSDDFTITLDAGQTLTAFVAPAAGLQPTLTILGPTGTTLAAATASAAGQQAVVQTVAVATAGTYTLRVASAGGTTGAYTLTANLNAAVEFEVHDGAADDTLATAQDLNASLVSLAASGVQRASVLGQREASGGYSAASVPYAFDDISTTGTVVAASGDDASAAIPVGFTFPFYGVDYTSVYVSTNGLISFGVADSAYANTDLTTSPAEPVIAPFWDDLYVGGPADSKIYYQVLGSGATTRLVVQWNNISFLADSTDAGGLTFEVVLGIDGSIRCNYRSLATGNNGGTHELGISATAGVKDTGTQGPNRVLLMYNNGPTALVDSLSSLVLTPSTVTPDYYAFSAAAGDTDTLAVTPLTTGNLILELLDGSGTVLATGASGATNLGSVIANRTFSGGGTYYLRITGDSGLAYSLLVTRNAAFDAEANDTSPTAGSLDGVRGVLGALTSSEDWYYVTAGSGLAVLNLSTSTPSDGAGQFENSLSPKIELYDPAGMLVASGAVGGDGRNESISYLNPAAGVYRVRVLAKNGTSGEYFLAASLGAAPGTVVGRYVFYNNSTFDGNNPAADASDDNAIAPDKTPLLPGGTAAFANYTSYVRGLNGIIVDIGHLAAQVTAADFEFRLGNDNNPAAWSLATQQPAVSIRWGAGPLLPDGITHADRVTLTWEDYYVLQSGNWVFNPNGIGQKWLQVTVKANANTGLSQNDVFYFGNAIGDSGDSAASTAVNIVDFGGARDNPHNAFNRALINDAYDFDRDQFVNVVELGLVRDNNTNAFNDLNLITVPASLSLALTVPGGTTADSAAVGESLGALIARSAVEHVAFTLALPGETATGVTTVTVSGGGARAIGPGPTRTWSPAGERLAAEAAPAAKPTTAAVAAQDAALRSVSQWYDQMEASDEGLLGIGPSRRVVVKLRR